MDESTERCDFLTFFLPSDEQKKSKYVKKCDLFNKTNGGRYKNKYILNFLLLHDFFCVRHFVMDELCKMDPY